MNLPPWKLTLVAFLVSFCSNWQFGYQISYVNTAVTTFHKLDNVTFLEDRDAALPEGVWSLHWGIIVASFYPGAVLGFLLTPWLLPKIGMNYTYIAPGALAILGSVIQCFVAIHEDTGNETMVFVSILSVGRFLVGVHGGAALALLPLWIREVSPPENCAFLSTFQQLAQAIASLLGLICGSYFFINAYEDLVFLQIIAIIPTALFIVALFLLPETPYHHFHRKPNWVKGENSIVFYYGSSVNLETVSVAILSDWQTADLQSAADGCRTLKTLFLPSDREQRLVRRGFLIGCLAAASYAFTTDDIIDSFSTETFFDSGKLSSMAANRATLAIGFVLFLSSLVGCWVVERIGRRLALIGGLIGTALGSLLAAILLVTAPIKWTIYAFAFTKLCIGLGAGAPAWFLTSELVTPGVRVVAQTISTAVLLLVSGIVTEFFSIFVSLSSSAGLVLFGTLPSLVCAFLLARYLPETKDRTLEQILNLLEGPQNARGFFQSQTRYGALLKDEEVEDEENAENQDVPKSEQRMLV